MTEISDDDFDLDVLMCRIRRDVEKRKAAAAIGSHAEVASPLGTEPVSGALGKFTLRRFEEAVPSFELKNRYRVEEFLRYHDEQFVRNAYRGILRREPDGMGLSSFLEPLRRDEISKIEILGRIRYSPEGRAVRMRVDGLAMRFALRCGRRVPVIGRMIGVLQYFVRLPDLAASLDRLERAYFQRELQARRQLDQNSSLVERTFADLDRRTTELLKKQRDEPLMARIAAVETALASVDGMLASKGDSAEVERLAAELERKVEAEQLTALAKALTEFAEAATARAELAATASRTELAALEERMRAKWGQTEFAIADLKDSDESLRLKLDVASRGEVRLPDSFYKDLEDKFRGSREDILERLQVYVPMIVKADAGTEPSPVLDVGCGRGEWLELLRTHGLVGHGVDADTAMVAECRRHGLRVTQGRAVEYMRSLWASSVGAVTAFHIVEHLPSSDVFALVDEAQRVLCPGGVLIMETPNPENLQVGANTFYIDPTHRRPIPPALLHFIAEKRGFTDVEVLRLHPFSDEDRAAAGASANSDGLNKLLFGPQDYAIVARKAKPVPASHD